MRLRETSIFKLILVGFATGLLLQGCSSPRPPEGGDKAGEDSGDPFHSDLMVEANPVEAEIAKDLTKLVKLKHHRLTRRPGSASMAEFGDGIGPESGKSKRYKPGKMKYKVKAGDTLMKISFKAFADPFRWREIYEDNKSKIQSPTQLIKGSIFTLRCAEFASIRRNGRPYLIRVNDTLAKISNGVYGTPTLWPRLWKNNPELIHDPNRIYAGFTLYYVSGKKDSEEKDTQKKETQEKAPEKSESTTNSATKKVLEKLDAEKKQDKSG